MHPPLFKDHPDCEPVVQALVNCHKEHSMGKFFGACNDAKAELDKCFRAEKEAKRKLNLVKARETQAGFELFEESLRNSKK